MVSTSAWLAFLASSTSTVALSAFKAKASLFSLIPLLASSKESNKPGFWSSPFKLLAKSETSVLILLIFSSFLLIALAISSSELFVDILLPSATE